jgi:predicted ATPase
VVETLLEAAPRLSILATSREALQVSLETHQYVPPLTLPKRSAGDCLTEAMGHSAVQLFVSRARARQHDFRLREQDVKAVLQICRQLDGLPLAIELAAAQIDALALVGLQAQMPQGLQVLSQGRRTAVSRHQSMQAALDWSYQRLSEQEQRAMQRLSVFKMAFTLEAALAVISCPQLASSRLAALIEGLARKSLLVVERGGNAGRYRLLNTTRCYAREQLERSGEGIELERRHARYIKRIRRASDVHVLA